MSNTLPTKHLSARVPWHDNRWNGTVCCNVLDNSFCRILPLIDAKKDEAKEIDNIKIEDHTFPPCISEKGTFLSPFSYSRNLIHAWSKINDLFREYGPSTYHHKPFSFNAVPFMWMIKTKGSDKDPHYSEKARTYELDYQEELEEEVDKRLGFGGNIWVQHPHNQRALLDSFFGCLKKKQSLVFFYCKHTPLSEPNERIIVGVAKVRNDVGGMLEYTFPNGYKGHKSYPWDRCVEHTLTGKNESEGFLMPYHELIEALQKTKTDAELTQFAVRAPDFAQFSFASELVEHDTAIDCLLLMSESLKKCSTILEKDFKQEQDWIDQEISKLWDMRGAFPGMGPVLSALGVNDGNSIAWTIEKNIISEFGELTNKSPWEVFESYINGEEIFPKSRLGELIDSTTKRIWKTLPGKKKEFLKILSRLFLNNDQAQFIVDSTKNKFGSVEPILENLYLLYEKTRFDEFGLNFRQIEKALLPPEKILNAFPLPNKTALEDDLDLRRLRALVIWILEEASSEGHSLLPFDDLLMRIQGKSLERDFPAHEDLLRGSIESDFCQEELDLIEVDKVVFVKLKRLSQIKTILRSRLNIEKIQSKTFNIDKDWLALVNETIEQPMPKEGDIRFDDELKARKEKAEALRVITNYKFSVLIGPAGSGKTTLLKAFEKQPEIRRGGLIKLAPTGKARVKLGADSQTVAQFLYPDRYDGKTGRYYPDENAPKSSTEKNIIIDEASMLTEEQLAAIFDALGVVDRIILVGDYRQLPPIGAGRPFVDIVSQVKPTTFENNEMRMGAAYAELQQIMRQAESGDRRWDVELSKCFGGDISKEQLEIFNELTGTKINSKHFRLEKWYESTDFREIFKRILTEELQLDENDIEKSFNRTIGAKDFGNYQYFNFDHAEKEIEKWQVISPVK